MQSIQMTFNDLLEAKKEAKDIRKEYKDILKNNEEYKNICGKIKLLQEDKKLHEFNAQQDLGSRWERLAELKSETKKLQEMISDISLTTLMNGETLEVRDEYDNLYTPNYNVNYKKVK